MKTIILAGGYAKRLWPLTINKPKSLLPIGGKPMIEYIMVKLETRPEITKIFISSNKKHAQNFKQWLSRYKSTKEIELIIEPTSSENNKMGSVGALGYVIKEKNIGEEIIIIAGDNLFEFDLRDLINYYREKKENVISLYNINSFKKAKNYGVVIIDKNKQIINFIEKPKNPLSTLVSTACYILSKDGTRSILAYLGEGGNPDDLGFFIKWLIKKDRVFGFVFSGRWFDIGSIESLKEADFIYNKKREKDL